MSADEQKQKDSSTINTIQNNDDHLTFDSSYTAGPIEKGESSCTHIFNQTVMDGNSSAMAEENKLPDSHMISDLAQNNVAVGGINKDDHFFDEFSQSSSRIGNQLPIGVGPR